MQMRLCFKVNDGVQQVEMKSVGLLPIMVKVSFLFLIFEINFFLKNNNHHKLVCSLSPLWSRPSNFY